MKLSKILPESPRLKTIELENSKKSKSKIELLDSTPNSPLEESGLGEELGAQALEKNDSFLKAPATPLEIKDKVTLTGKNPQKEASNEAMTVKKTTSQYSNPVQRVKADKIQEMTQRFFMTQPKVEVQEKEMVEPEKMKEETTLAMAKELSEFSP